MPLREEESIPLVVADYVCYEAGLVGPLIVAVRDNLYCFPDWSLPPSRLSFRFLLRCDSSELPKSCHLAQGSADVVLTRVNQLGTVKTLGQDVDEEASFAHVDLAPASSA